MSGNDSFFGAATNIGNRTSQQDEYLIVRDLFEGTPHTSLFAVFDGHGSDGGKVSAFVKCAFPKVLRDQRSGLIGPPAAAKTALRDSFATVNAMLQEDPAIDCYMSGSTAVLMLFFEEERRVLIANLGDSRIIMGRLENDETVPMQVSTLSARSTDHTCSNPEEFKRVKDSGARVDQMQTEDGRDGPLRIYKGTLPYPGLVVTRSLGDTCADRLGVISDPEVIERELSRKDRFFVLASDGLWDGLDIEEVVRLVVKYDEPQKASDILIKRALKGLDAKAIDDNVTVIVVQTK
ncbi:hypothetical protein HK100_012865 [Physocladia obscura]|uniref:PPM-type phosphatase domain-containing protein n=1 Tax=Physocladia obscura TaxID=109957 RepID=A0AAD5XHA7_9FUNG|nr:hypothetical protein HK100_012865 [Physocladia obscura]